MNTLPPPTLVPITGVMHQLSISRGTVYNLIHAKKLVQVHIGTRAFVPQESIDKFVDRLQAEAAVDDSENVTEVAET